ncbi:hypothetical protein [Rhodobium gokarnense]|uniref:Uncharacterized protein n=1 Tax=Rhodobium gokarnense TaxID=364296 RepID=A0ABT3H7T8_9HYPH|nr:hypothetical protein [Rhodobium gokarnense]MCW2306453.1 hypothetical protein [Rhodobium gokarnense]
MVFAAVRHWLGDMFRKDAPVVSAATLADFLDAHAAFIVQKCIYEYARARAGTMSLALFKEEGFKAAVETSRWQNYPLGLRYVGEMAMNVLRPDWPGSTADLSERLAGIFAQITNRYPVPDGFPEDFWQNARQDISRHLARAALAPAKPVKDIPLATVEQFFARLPIHERLRGYDYQLIQNNLRINLCRSYETLRARLDREALCADLAADSGAIALRAGA